MNYLSALNSKKIKYLILEPMISGYMLGVNEVNCFISLNSLLKSFYGYNADIIAEDLSNISFNALSSEIINIAAHYRHYFWSRHHVPTTFYIYYSTEMSDYCLNINTSYKKKYYSKRNGTSSIKEYNTINTIIEKNYELINIISEYLPNIFFINTGTFESSATPQFLLDKNINKDMDGVLNLVLTADKIDFQLCTNHNTLVINVDSDLSKLITKDKLLETLFGSKKSPKKMEISPYFYVPMLSIIGYKSYDIDGIRGYGPIATYKRIGNLIDNGSIENIEYKSMDKVSKLISPKFPLDADKINNNFKILSYKNLSNNITKKEFINIKKQLVNKSDNMSLMSINDKYYRKNPLMLIELMEGE
jgi:hypothetical protein